MAHSLTSEIIIRTALDHPGLLTAREVAFVRSLSQLPARQRLSVRQVDWLYQIGRSKLNLPYKTPSIPPVVDLRARAVPDSRRLNGLG